MLDGPVLNVIAAEPVLFQFNDFDVACPITVDGEDGDARHLNAAIETELSHEDFIEALSGISGSACVQKEHGLAIARERIQVAEIFWLLQDAFGLAIEEVGEDECE